MTEKKTKKVLRIRKGEYMLEMQPHGMLTTHNNQKALDITNWTMPMVGRAISALKGAGYKFVGVETVEIMEEPAESLVNIDVAIEDLIDQNDSPEMRKKAAKLKKYFEKTVKETAESGKKIGDALQDVQKRMEEKAD